jgi:hypothetical protein
MNFIWTCKCCGKAFNSLSFAYSLNEPDPWRAISEAEREQRGVLTSDRCAIDDKEFYVRGRLEIPVTGSKVPFVWGVWASVSKTSFERIEMLWDAEKREHETPLFGWLSSDVPLYPQTFNLKCNLYLRDAGKRPSIVLEPTDHPLAIEQRNGITIERVKEIAAVVLQHSM